MQTKRVTILVCDNVPEPDRSRFGDVPDQVSKHLNAVAASLGWRLALKPVDVRVAAPPETFDDTDLFVITGSASEPYSALPWIVRLRRWVRTAHARKARFFGICFGHQIIAQALGGETAKASGWEVGIVAMQQNFELLAGGQVARTSSPPAAPTQPDDLRLLMSHQDEVTRLPDGAAHWLRGADCVFQGMVFPGQIVTVQGHPEYWSEQIRSLYERRRTTLGEERTDAAQASALGEHDGASVTATALQHLLA